MTHQLTLALAGSTAVLLAACATKVSSDSHAPTGPPSATVRITESQAAYDASTLSGKGTISYQGRDQGFTISGLGVGGTGVQNISATGQVYNLNSLSDFPGSYTGVRSGLTLIKGKMHSKLTNSNGVVLYLTGHTTGLASSTGADKLVIKMK